MYYDHRSDGVGISQRQQSGRPYAYAGRGGARAGVPGGSYTTPDSWRSRGVNRSYGVDRGDGVGRDYGMNRRRGDGVDRDYGMNRRRGYGVDRGDGVDRDYGMGRRRGYSPVAPILPILPTSPIATPYIPPMENIAPYIGPVDGMPRDYMGYDEAGLGDEGYVMDTSAGRCCCDGY